jgi:hypothetical protein
MIVVSLVLNILVLIPVTASLVWRAGWTIQSFGERTPARDILLSVYFAILAASAGLLVAVSAAPHANWVSGAVAALLAVQVFYKITTAVAVRRSLRNPVVLSNLGIAVVHLITLWVIVSAGALR